MFKNGYKLAEAGAGQGLSQAGLALRTWASWKCPCPGPACPCPWRADPEFQIRSCSPNLEPQPPEPAAVTRGHQARRLSSPLTHSQGPQGWRTGLAGCRRTCCQNTGTPALLNKGMCPWGVPQSSGLRNKCTREAQSGPSLAAGRSQQSTRTRALEQG